MITGLSDKQLAEAFKAATDASFARGYVMLSPAGLRAVADLAITHLEAENHALRQELEALKEAKQS